MTGTIGSNWGDATPLNPSLGYVGGHVNFGNAEHRSFDRGAAVTIEITNETESPFVDRAIDRAFGGLILERSSIGEGR